MQKLQPLKVKKIKKEQPLYAPLEKYIQKQIINYLTILENMGKIYFIRAGSGEIYLKDDKGRSRAFKSGKTGCPDIIVLYQGKFMGIEVKRLKGKQSDSQKEAEKKILKCGGGYYIVRSVDEVMQILK